MTLKDERQGIAAVLVDEGFDVRSLKVGPPDQAPVEKPVRASQWPCVTSDRKAARPADEAWRVHRFCLGRQPRRHAADALPMGGDDGQRRYRLGTMNVIQPPKEGR